MLYKVLLAGLIGTCLSVYFKEHKNTIGFFIVIAASLLIVFLTLSSFTQIGEKLSQLFSVFEGESKYLTMLLKMLGITYVCDLTAGICKDSGNSSIAHQMMTFGKILILSLSLPVISNLFEIVSGLL